MKYWVFMFLVACGAPVPQTVGDFCEDWGAASCDSLRPCVDDFNENCVNDFVALCCGDENSCGTPIEDDVTRREYNDCLNDLEDRSCETWEAGGAMPASCQTL